MKRAPESNESDIMSEIDQPVKSITTYFKGIQNLPKDVTTNIYKFLPIQQFIGSNKVTRTCKNWYRDDINVTFPWIIKACLEDPSIVMQILSEKEIVQRLSWQQFIELSSCHPDLAWKMYEDDLNRTKLNGYELLTLSRHTPKIIKSLLDLDFSRSVFEEFSIIFEDKFKSLEITIQNGFNLAELNVYLPNFVSKIISDETGDILNGLDFSNIESKHMISMAKALLASDQLKVILNKYGHTRLFMATHLLETLSGLGGDLLVLEEILKNSEQELVPLLYQIGNDALFEMYRYDQVARGYWLMTCGQHRLEIAQKMLATPFICNLLSAQHLMILGKHHPEITSQVLHTADLVKKLSDKNLITLAQYHPDMKARIKGILASRGGYNPQNTEEQNAIINEIHQHVKEKLGDRSKPLLKM